ncbi:MAG: hypothetical protein WAW31_15010 [Smithella sp.]
MVSPDSFWRMPEDFLVSRGRSATASASWCLIKKCLEPPCSTTVRRWERPALSAQWLSRTGEGGFLVTFTEAGEAITDLGEIQCVVSQASMSIPSVQTPAGINDQSVKAQPVPEKKQAAKTVLFAFPDAD